MRRYNLLASVFAFALVFGGSHDAMAQCTLPYQLTNGQTADASQVMADFNALVACLNAAAPAGGTNAVQYNAGSGNFGAVGPLTNGQIVIGSTGAAPQAQTLTAGAGITITNSAGGITIATTGASTAGLYAPIMSPTPTSAGTGLTNWLNQGTSVVSDSPVGISINAPSAGSDNVVGRFMAAPSAPYTITALIAATRDSNSFNAVGLGWYDGSSKLHAVSYVNNNGGVPLFQVQKWNSVTSFNANDYQSSVNGFAQPIWLQIHDDGTNISFAFSQDGSNYLKLFSTAKSSGFLGSTGYSNIIFMMNPRNSATMGTVMSWTQN